LRTVSSTFVGSFRDDLPRDVESMTNSSRSRRETFRDRFTRMFFDVRTMDDRDREADLVPIQPRIELSEWPPLNVDKKRSQQVPVPKQKRRKSRWCCIILLIIILLYLLGNVVFLDVRIASLTGELNSVRNQTTSSPSPLSFNANECVSQFTLNAPVNPSSYPCGSCLAALSGVTPGDPSQDFQQATNALQFCGLRAVLQSADSTGQTTLGNGGWATNVNFCTWQGVTCDTSGRVNSL
jgi:hypothetical protein